MVLFTAVMLLLILLNVPIAFAIGMTSLGYLLALGTVPLAIIPQRLVGGIDSFVLLAIPFFILAAQLMNTAGITRRIFDFADAIVGHIRGGLGHVNVVGSMIFAGMSGSAVSDAAGLGLIEIEAMERAGYDREFSAAITAASATIGPIIPPSIPMVVYGAAAQVSVGRLFAAGIIPGILMGITLMIAVYIIALRRDFPVHPGISFKRIARTSKDAFLPLLTPVILIGGVLSGVFTPTESAVIAVIYAFLLGFFVYKEITLQDIPKLLQDTIVSTAVVMLIFGVVSVFGWIITREQIPQLFAKFIVSVTTSQLGILSLIMLFLLFVGCFMNPSAAIVVLVPIFKPLIDSAGIDPVYFGLLMVLNLMIGLLTPPVAQILFVVSNIAKIPFARMCYVVIPFIIPILATLVLLILFPSLVMFMPNLIFG